MAKDADKSVNSYVHSLKRWEHDYQLEEIDRLHLFDEYIEMSNFITILVNPIFGFKIQVKSKRFKIQQNILIMDLNPRWI